MPRPLCLRPFARVERRPLSFVWVDFLLCFLSAHSPTSIAELAAVITIPVMRDRYARTPFLLVRLYSTAALFGRVVPWAA